MRLPPPEPASSLRTRPSLIMRLRDWQDSVSWTEFHRLYYRLIYNLARRSGLPHAEAEEVSQDVFCSVAENIGRFSPRPNCGSFRRWLLNLTRWRIIDHRRRQRGLIPRGPQRPEDDEGREPRIDGVPDFMVREDVSWESEWQAGVLEAALERVARLVPPKKFQVFELYTCQAWPALKVARTLGINPARVYLISHRITKRVKREVDRLIAQIG